MLEPEFNKKSTLPISVKTINLNMFAKSGLAETHHYIIQDTAIIYMQACKHLHCEYGIEEQHVQHVQSASFARLAGGTTILKLARDCTIQTTEHSEVAMRNGSPAEVGTGTSARFTSVRCQMPDWHRLRSRQTTSPRTLKTMR